MSNKRFDESGYQRKLKDPRWQKRRLELLNKAGWKCEEPACLKGIISAQDGSDPPSLQTHHLYYKCFRMVPTDLIMEVFYEIVSDRFGPQLVERLKSEDTAP